MAARKKPSEAKEPEIPELPEGIRKTDLKRPANWDDLHRLPDTYQDHFEMWYSQGFGWCIPTLLIGRSRRANQAYSGGERTYAVRVSDGSTVRIGNGPHIKARVTVYLRKDRMDALQKFLDLMGKGAERANTIRDRISTRRAQGALRRSLW